MPAVPPSRASVITFHAPASSSSFSHVIHSSAVYSTDESFEPTSERTVKSRAKSAISSSFALARDVDRAVGDLDVREAELGEPPLVLVELARRVDDLEERAADHDRLLAQHVELALEVARDVRGAPAELDDRDVVARHLEDVLPAARAEALVDHVGQADVPRQVEIKGGQRAPSASPGPRVWTSW